MSAAAAHIAHNPPLTTPEGYFLANRSISSTSELWLIREAPTNDEMTLEPTLVAFRVFDRQHDPVVAPQVLRLPARGVGAERDLVAMRDHPDDRHLGRSVGVRGPHVSNRIRSEQCICLRSDIDHV